LHNNWEVTLSSGFRTNCCVSPAKASHAECERIIQLLKQERERRGFSKYLVAQESGLSQQAIGYMEKGHRIPSLETVLRVAKALNVDLARIIRQAQKEVLGKQTTITNQVKKGDKP
jgi:transcriptional regulator with XRE-family HTH domain